MKTKPTPAQQFSQQVAEAQISVANGDMATVAQARASIEGMPHIDREQQFSSWWNEAQDPSSRIPDEETLLEAVGKKGARAMIQTAAQLGTSLATGNPVAGYVASYGAGQTFDKFMGSKKKKDPRHKLPKTIGATTARMAANIFGQELARMGLSSLGITAGPLSEAFFHNAVGPVIQTVEGEARRLMPTSTEVAVATQQKEEEYEKQLSIAGATRGAIKGAVIGTTVAAALALLYNYATGQWKADMDDIFKVPDPRDLISSLSQPDREFLSTIMDRHPEFRVGSEYYNIFAMMLKINRKEAYETLMPLYDRMSVTGNLGAQRALELIERFTKKNPGNMWRHVKELATAGGIIGAIEYGSIGAAEKMYKKLATPKKFGRSRGSDVERKKKKKKKKKQPMPAQRPSERPASPKKKKKSTTKGRTTRGARSFRVGGTAYRQTNDDLLALFKRLDKNDNGNLNEQELAPLATAMSTQAGKLMQGMDQDDNKKVTWPEFRKYMRRA